MQIKICGQEVRQPKIDESSPFFGVIWGPAGTGKTTLAATAPGKMLLYNFDTGGDQSLGKREDMLVVDLSAEKYSCLSPFRVESDPGDVKKAVAADPAIKTVIIDSLTMINEHALPMAVNESKNSTIKEPGQHGYAHRNRIVYEIVKNMFTTCASLRLNFIIVGHEAKAEKDEITGRMFQSMLIGGELATFFANRFSEVWYVEDVGSVKRIHTRSNSNKKPMKTRMFETTGGEEFDWKYDPRKPIDTQSQWTVRGWVEQWHKGGGVKIALPK